MSRVSWPITARTGEMYVRAAGDGYEEFVVVLDLGPSQGAAGDGARVSPTLRTDPKQRGGGAASGGTPGCAIL